jgi:hypothetical protein
LTAIRTPRNAPSVAAIVQETEGLLAKLPALRPAGAGRKPEAN